MVWLTFRGPARSFPGGNAGAFSSRFPDTLQGTPTPIGDLLEVSRVGRAAVPSDRVRMGPPVRGAIPERISSSPDRRMDLQIGDLGRAWGNRFLLRQVVTNLVLKTLEDTGRRDQAVVEGGATYIFTLPSKGEDMDGPDDVEVPTSTDSR